LLTRFNTPGGQQNVWTTFGADQIDLNYRNPDVLLEIIDTLLFYVTRGAECIRLDAIAYLWKEIGTPCIHLPQTHLVVQILRAVLEEIAPHVLLITETNVPHRENISYFGDGGNEAQMVYNFALPPLTLHAFHTANAETLSRWANTLTLPSKRVTFFNFLASHDGIGITPARDLLTRAEIDALVEHVQHHGGLVSARTNSDGTTSVYELNINYFDALSNPHAHEPLDTQIDRFMTAQAIMLSLVGVPGIYFHSLFGSRGWREGVKATGHNRAINREKCDLQTLERELADRNSRRCQVFARYKQLLQARAAHRAFDPFGEMRVLDVGRSVFAVWRVSARGDQRVLCLHNVSERAQSVALGGSVDSLSGQLTDLITGQMVDVEHLRLVPYQVLWLSF
jgi:sucrose phosphorylase